jgi:hypothetical protein
MVGRLGALSFTLAELRALDLARGREGNLVYELEGSGIEVVGDVASHVFLDVGFELVVGRAALPELDERFDYLPRVPSETPIAAARRTASWRTRQSSISLGPIR